MNRSGGCSIRYECSKLGPLQMIEITGEGREIIAGKISIRTIVRATVMIGPGDELVSLRIMPLALIVSAENKQWAISIDGEPADVESILDMIL